MSQYLKIPRDNLERQNEFNPTRVTLMTVPPVEAGGPSRRVIQRGRFIKREQAEKVGGIK